MNAEWLTAIASCVSAVIAVVGVPFILLQLRDVRRSQFSNSISSVYETFVQLDRFFIEKPEYRAFVYEQKPREDIPTALQPAAESVAEFVTDIMYQAFNQKAAIGLSLFAPEVAYIQGLFRSPLMRNFLSSHKEWYKEEFVTMAIPQEQQQDVTA